MPFSSAFQVPFFLFFLVISTAGKAVTVAADFDDLKKVARAKKLSQNSTWLSLMHYYKVGSEAEGYESFVDDENFFLAADGKRNSQAELDKSIERLLFPDVEKDTLVDPRCQFVERERWLRQQLDLSAEAVPESCSDYYLWRSRIKAHSVTLVFPASYLNSPSSMFGHTLFRFDPSDIENNSAWLSYSLSYAANVTEQEEDSFAYAFKGIAGGYPGRFSVVPYFKKIQEYGALENRDVWEYKLNLTVDEVDRMVGHIWELHDIRFDYFFFRENCAFRLLELLDYARPGLELSSGFNFTAIPADTVKAVVHSGIVENVNYRPSIGAELQYQLALLPKGARQWVELLEKNPDLANSEKFLALDIPLQRSLISAANRFLTYKSRRKKMTDKTVNKRFKMLQSLNRYPSKKPVSPAVPEQPDSGHDTRLISLGAGRDHTKDFVELQYRISYHDLLDNIPGYLKGAEIELGDLHVKKYKAEQAKLDSFDLIQIRSLNAWYALFNPISWEAGVGLYRNELLEDNRLSVRLNAMAGRSFLWRKQSVFYALAGFDTNFYRHANHTAYLNVSAKVGVLDYNPFGTMQVQLEVESFQRHSSRADFDITQNFELARNHALRASFNFSRFNEQNSENFKLEYRHYF